MKQLSSIRVLARQGIAFHGNTEEQSNLHQFLLCRVDDKTFSVD